MDNSFRENLSDVLEASRTHITRFNTLCISNANTFVELANALNKYNDDVNVLNSYNRTTGLLKDLLDNMQDVVNDCIARDNLIIQLIDEIEK